MHVIAAKAVAFKLAMTPEFREKQERTLRGASILADRLLADDARATGRRRRHRRHRRAPGARGPAQQRAGRQAGRGPARTRPASPPTATPCPSTRARPWSPAASGSAPRPWPPAASATPSSPRSPTSSRAPSTRPPTWPRCGERVAVLTEKFPLYTSVGRSPRERAAPRRQGHRGGDPPELTGRVAVLRERGRRARARARCSSATTPGSASYVAGKHRDCAEVGITSVREDLPADATQADVLAAVARLNADPSCTGYIVQLPLPAGLDQQAVLEAVDPDKDADGLHPTNLGRLVLQVSGEITSPLPCTPRGIVELLGRYDVPAVRRRRRRRGPRGHRRAATSGCCSPARASTPRSRSPTPAPATWPTWSAGPTSSWPRRGRPA